MRACIQRVTAAQVAVQGDVIAQIDRGLLVLLGVAADDTPEDARELADKIVELRIFEDEVGKMNLSLRDVSGSMLVVSQFTLLGDCRKGRRPSFTAAAPPEPADALYQRFVQRARESGIPTATGRFREHMQVTLTNDGPVTLLVDSRKQF